MWNRQNYRQNSETADSLFLWQVQSLHSTNKKQKVSVYGYGTSLVGICLEDLVITDRRDAWILIPLTIIQF